MPPRKSPDGRALEGAIKEIRHAMIYAAENEIPLYEMWKSFKPMIGSARRIADSIRLNASQEILDKIRGKQFKKGCNELAHWVESEGAPQMLAMRLRISVSIESIYWDALKKIFCE